MELMCARELGEKMNMSVLNVESRLLHFMINHFHLFSEILPYSHSMILLFKLISPETLVVYGIEMFSSKKLTGELMAPNLNVFMELGMMLEKSVCSKDVATV